MRVSRLNNLPIYDVVPLLNGIMHKTSGWKETLHVSMSQFIFVIFMKLSLLRPRGWGCYKNMSDLSHKSPGNTAPKEKTQVTEIQTHTEKVQLWS